MRAFGVRRWGNSPDGSTEILTGTYNLEGEVSRRLLDALPSRLILRADEWQTPLIGVNDRLRRCRRVVAERVVIRTAHERDVAGAHPGRVAAVRQEPGAAAEHRHQAQRRLVLDPQRPRRLEGAAEQERPPRARPIEQPCDRIHRVSLDARVSNRDVPPLHVLPTAASLTT